MSPDDENTAVSPEVRSGNLGLLTPAMVAHLRGTHPWVRFVSIVGFVGSGLLVVVAVILSLVAALTPKTGVMWGAGMGALYLLLAALYFFPSLLLLRYSRAIRGLLATGEAGSMELALAHQRSFWRLVGIATLVLLGVYVVGLIIIFLVALVGAFTRGLTSG